MTNSLSKTHRLQLNKSNSLNPLESFQTGDVLVLFGELFQKGYANGLVDAAQKKGLKIIYSTVGRRDEQQNLRSLNSEESKSIPSPWINVPLESGFDLEPSSPEGNTPVDLCKSIGLKEGIHGHIDLNLISQSQEKGVARFRNQVRAWLQELHQHLKPNSKVFMAHLMAGGVPRSKIILSLMNRVFKGVGDRYLSSEDFWNSDLGQFCQKSFFEVTANSFNILIEESAPLRKKLEEQGGFIHYSAYGYHGTPIFFENQLQWLCYTPYLQGFAKKQLENFARQHWDQGVKATVYNCPEILTSSSGIFPGVEIFLYPLYFELQRRKIQHPLVLQMMQQAESLLKPGGLEQIQKLISHFLHSSEMQKTLNIDLWPQHSTKPLMELMLKTSDEIISLHHNPQALMTTALSELIIHASGSMMLQETFQPQEPVTWIGHDAVISYYEHPQI